MATPGARLCSIILVALVAQVVSSSTVETRIRFLATPPTGAPADPAGQKVIRSSEDSAREGDDAPGDRQLTLLGSATAARTVAQQPGLEDPVRAFYRGLADDTAPVPEAQVQPPLPTLSPWGMQGLQSVPPTLQPPPMPLGVLPIGKINPSTGTDVKAKMGELNTAVNNVLSELTQQLEQQQQFAVEKEEQLQKEQAQVQTLTQENMQLGAQVAQLQASRVGMVEDAKSLRDDFQAKLGSWINKYESSRGVEAPVVNPPVASPQS